MPISSRHYVFEEGGGLKRIPKRLVMEIFNGHEVLPEYAGTVQKIADVLVETEGGRPVRIIDATGTYWKFDADGRVDQDNRMEVLRHMMDLAFESPPQREGKVVDLRPDIKRNKLNDMYRWTPSAEDLQRVAADLWPDLAEAPEVKYVKGKAPKRPALTQDAKEAISELHARFATVDLVLKDLSEPALKGFIHEAERISKAYLENRHLWHAMALEAQRVLDIKVRHRTGKGGFYALLHVWRQVDARTSEEIDTIEVPCSSKKEAISKARQILAENAHRFGEDVNIEAQVLSELEWSPIEAA